MQIFKIKPKKDVNNLYDLSKYNCVYKDYENIDFKTKLLLSAIVRSTSHKYNKIIIYSDRIGYYFDNFEIDNSIPNYTLYIDDYLLDSDQHILYKLKNDKEKNKILRLFKIKEIIC